ncbi:Alpha/Beta hydrolase protein [Phycomyces blakesleeanus]|uniref:Carboxypeptidase n=2 Tax=Phycomyces blakesleeanus TaxID=4837 RepID=A0ABR3B902_PHYBL
MRITAKLFTIATAITSLVIGQVVAETNYQIPFVNSVDTQEFKILTNDAVEGYAVRVKEPKSCESGVQYSGYIDNLETDDHFFFWFFESRTLPKSDPTVLWLNGGPGCSSMMGLWMELGPCQVSPFGNETFVNPYSWNTLANVIFLDQPVNVGYSYGKSKIRSTKEAARDVYAFLQLFLSEFTEYAENPFHISGESYAGHYLPAIATEIIENNKDAGKHGRVPIKFDSMLIGNGWTNPRTQFKYYQEFGCTKNGEVGPIFDKKTCQGMVDTYPRCKSLMDTCYKHPSALTCIPATLYCEKTQAGPFDKTGLNPYDIRMDCEGDSGLCYNLIESIEIWANEDKVRAELGVDPKAGNYTGCSDSVGFRFGKTGDNAFDFSSDVAQTLIAGVRVLLYVGDKDWICNWIGNKAWSLEMDWPGRTAYNEAVDHPWHSWLTGEKAGEVRSANNLTFLRIYDAGHMVPYDQPANALDFFGRWINHIPLSFWTD